MQPRGYGKAAQGDQPPKLCPGHVPDRKVSGLTVTFGEEPKLGFHVLAQIRHIFVTRTFPHPKRKKGRPVNY